MAEPILTEAQSRDFIEKLSTDDSFRQRLIENPNDTISEFYGVTLDPKFLPEEVTLPSKKDVAENFEDYIAGASAALGCLRIFKWDSLP